MITALIVIGIVLLIPILYVAGLVLWVYIASFDEDGAEEESRWERER